MNAMTDWEEIPECALAGVMREVFQRVLGLRAKFGDRARILIQNNECHKRVQAGSSRPRRRSGPSDTCWARTSLSNYACSSGGGVVRGGGE